MKIVDQMLAVLNDPVKREMLVTELAKVSPPPSPEELEKLRPAPLPQQIAGNESPQVIQKLFGGQQQGLTDVQQQNVQQGKSPFGGFRPQYDTDFRIDQQLMNDAEFIQKWGVDKQGKPAGGR